MNGFSEDSGSTGAAWGWGWSGAGEDAIVTEPQGAICDTLANFVLGDQVAIQLVNEDSWAGKIDFLSDGIGHTFDVVGTVKVTMVVSFVETRLCQGKASGRRKSSRSQLHCDVK